MTFSQISPADAQAVLEAAVDRFGRFQPHLLAVSRECPVGARTGQTLQLLERHGRVTPAPGAQR